MIVSLEPIGAGGVGFFALSGTLIALAWSRWRAVFLSALVLASLVMLASWLSWLDAAALAVFVALPYPAIRWIWGRPDRAAGFLQPMVVAVQVFIFLVLRRYSGFDFLGDAGYVVSIVGLSFVLFRQIHLIIDAPLNAGLRFSPALYLGYLLAFWTLIAGPLQRYQAFLQGVDAVGRPPAAVLLDASHRVVNGLLKAFVLAPLFLEPSRVTNLMHPAVSWIDVAVVLYGFPVYLYLNFSGYTDIVIGIARLCGIETMPENFNHPWLARNIQDFWMRWHISFSTWIRDYLFMPLQIFLYRRLSGRAEVLITTVSVLITFVVVGAWHGTTSNFVLFGFLHGLGMLAGAAYGAILHRMLGRERAKSVDGWRGTRWISTFVCFHFVCATFIVFNNPIDDIVKSLQAFTRGVT